jgi:hypothetical protein
VDDATDAVDVASVPARRLPVGEGAVMAVAAAASARLGLKPISDNSTLVHLRTGIELVRTGHVPRSDPYSFTAAGHPWVVQSWLASLTYGWANNIGHHALVIEQGLLMALVGVVTTLAARSATVWRTALAAGLALCASAPGWSPRPLMFALLTLALTIVVVERRLHPLWLVPVVWVWVNSHGSYPLGLAWVGAYGLGSAIDLRAWPKDAARYVGAFVVGGGVACINPLGPKLLTFPLVALHKRSTFQNIVEWRSPNFQSGNSLIALVFIALALVVLLRAALPWRELLPVCGFVVAALVAERNLAPLGIVLAPALGAALASAPPRRFARSLIGMRSVRVAVTGLATVAAAVLVVRSLGQPTLDLSSYPVAATNELARTGRLNAPHRIAAVDVVGCYLIWRAGPSTKVFIDDRYDMYPPKVTSAAEVLAGGRSDVGGVLDEWHIDTVLWSLNQALPAELLTLGGWHETWVDAQWAVLERS